MKASELIRNECCGVGLLSVEKAELVKKAKLLEDQIVFLENQLKNAINKINKQK